MPVVTLKTAPQYEALLAAYIVSRTPGLTDIEPGSVLRQIVGAVARMAEIGSFTTAQLVQLFSIYAAQGADLDARAQDYLPIGVTRQGSSRATGTVRWTRSIATASPVVIPAGTRFARPGSNPPVSYVTTAPGWIPAASTASVRTDGPGGDIPARAESPGSAGNTAINTTTVTLSTLAGISAVTNPTPFTGGVDQETDDQFRARIVEYTSTLARSTRNALEFRAKQAEVNGRRVVLAKALQSPYYAPGSATLLIDDGSGTAESFASTIVDEDLITSATGGESRFYVDNFPLRGSAWTVTLDPASGPTVVLTPGTDYLVVAPWGLVQLSPTAFPSGLAAGDRLYIGPYTYYTELVAEAQRLIDGDPADPVNLPMWRSEGVVITVKVPTVITVNVACSIVTTEGFARDAVRSLVQQAIAAYIASLNIGDDVILAAMIERAMSVAGMLDVVFTSPASNIAIGDEQLARANLSNIVVT